MQIITTEKLNIQQIDSPRIENNERFLGVMKHINIENGKKFFNLLKNNIVLCYKQVFASQTIDNIATPLGVMPDISTLEQIVEIDNKHVRSKNITNVVPTNVVLKSVDSNNIKNKKPVLIEIRSKKNDLNGKLIRCKMTSTRSVSALEGTPISKSIVPCFKPQHKILREKLLSSRIVVENGEGMVFSRDYEFDSPSQAACVILGGNCDGWKTFRVVETGDYIETIRNSFDG